MTPLRKKPLVTVLMPVYNGEEHLGEALDSLLGQAFEDFELLAIDDGSTDGSGKILESRKDSRVRVVKNRENLGQTATLNRGLELAKGELIARADQDDIYLKDRLGKQAAFLNAHSDF
ncbi:MAG: glycosyltransferase family A protein, partial [Gemmatimonadota bacterium]|nr:glycosyltransferase family A protein [Gemmatimonadota bacterium]